MNGIFLEVIGNHSIVNILTYDFLYGNRSLSAVDRFQQSGANNKTAITEIVNQKKMSGFILKMFKTL